MMHLPIAGILGGAVYAPLAMTFDGSTGYYRDNSFTVSAGNKQTLTAIFNTTDAGGHKWIFDQVSGTNVPRLRASVRWIGDGDGAKKLQVSVSNSSSTIICTLYSINDVDDGVDHSLYFNFDGDAGTADFRIDGVEADDTDNPSRVAPTTGTLAAGVGFETYVGVSENITQFFNGPLSFLGYAGFTVPYSSLFESNGNPKRVDETIWTQWGGTRPMTWNENAKMDDDKGDIGPYTKFGTITGPA